MACFYHCKVTEFAIAIPPLDREPWRLSDLPTVGRPDAWRIESDSVRLCPSLHVVRNLLAGEMGALEKVRSVRPAGGLEPVEQERIIGRVFPDNYQMGCRSHGKFSEIDHYAVNSILRNSCSVTSVNG